MAPCPTSSPVRRSLCHLLFVAGLLFCGFGTAAAMLQLRRRRDQSSALNRDRGNPRTPKVHRLPNVLDNGVLMTAAEQAVVLGSLGKDKTMLEYGTGGSTKYYSKFVGKYYTIEHNPKFFGKMKPDLDALPNVVAHLEPVEKGYNGWPGGMNAGNYAQFHSYVHSIDKLGVRQFDVILVDGRARVACAVNALKYLHKDSVVLVHDFRGNPEHRNRTRQYEQIAFFYDIVDSADTIVRLKPKPEMLQIAQYVDLEQLYAWQTDPRRRLKRYAHSVL